MNLSEFEFLMRDYPSLASRRHSQLLFGLVRWLQPQSVVEVGTWQGYTACWIARALQCDLRQEWRGGLAGPGRYGLH